MITQTPIKVKPLYNEHVKDLLTAYTAQHSTEAFWDIWDAIEGWQTCPEANALLECCKDKVVLEIGAYHGKSTFVFAEFAEQVTTVDPFLAGGKEDCELLQHLNENLLIVSKSSDEFFESIEGSMIQYDLIYLDGDHTFHQMCRDIKHAVQFLKPNGVLAIHDVKGYYHKLSTWAAEEIKAALQYTLASNLSEQSIDSLLLISNPVLKAPYLFELPLPPRQPRILLLGDNSNPVADYYQIFKEMGYYVFWAGDGAAHFDTINFKRNIEVNAISMQYAGEAVVYTRRYPLSYLLDQIGRDFDVILQFQGWYYPSDTTKSPIPHIYYCSEGWWPEIPKSVWKVAVPNEQTKQLILLQGCNSHISECDISVIPFSIGGVFNNRKLNADRPIKASWAGDLYRFALLYKERRDLLYPLIKDPRLKDQIEAHWVDGKPWNYDGPHWKQGKGKLDSIDYPDLLDRSQFGINIPTRLGSNFRDLEVPACGACLVTKRTPDLLEMGFVDKENCYLYSTYEELVAILQQPYNPAVALKGYWLVNSKHRHIHRIPLFEALFSQVGVKPMGLRSGMYHWQTYMNKPSEVVWDLDRPLPA